LLPDNHQIQFFAKRPDVLGHLNHCGRRLTRGTYDASAVNQDYIMVEREGVRDYRIPTVSSWR
jgi:hypothetical protein